MRRVLRMGKKLLIVASKRYGDYVKEIAESMGCFEAISFVDNDREGAIGKLEEVETFYLLALTFSYDFFYKLPLQQPRRLQQKQHIIFSYFSS